MRTFIVVLVVVVAAAAVAFYALHSGLYDVSALRPHSRMFVRMAHIAADNSVRRQAKQITVPPLGSTAQLANGFLHFHEMCVVCHGAPGIMRSEIGEGLYPPPPDLKEAIADWTPAELYWIIKTGFKDTGMPAFGPTHSDQDLWAMTAFALRLPNMTPSQYDSLRVLAGLPKPGEHEDDDHGDGGHGEHE
ncbi:MAG TPA: cytochrome c [bacterium]|jgi:mono/diheme cytochrome c family protein